jgi:hypothetical protein
VLVRDRDVTLELLRDRTHTAEAIDQLQNQQASGP